MKLIRMIISMGAFGLFAAPLTLGQSWQWATKPIGLASTNFDHNSVTKVSVDELGNSLIVGVFNDSATFQVHKLKSLNGLDIYVAKLNPNGALQWVRTVGGDYAGDQAIDVTTDPAGNAYIAGFFGDSLNFDGTIVRRGPFSRVAIAKYNSSGTRQWARVAEGIVIANSGGIAYSSTGHFYLACGFTLGKYTTDGDTVWTRQIPFASNTLLFNDVDVDDAGNFIYVTGQFAGSIDIGGYTFNSLGLSDFDILVAKYDKDGNVVWAKRAGNTSNGIYWDIGSGIQVDQSGNTYVCGQFSGTSYFDADSLSSDSAYSSLFVAKYSDNGTLQWVRGGTSTTNLSSSQASDVRLVANETAVLVACTFGGSVTFGGATYTILGGDALIVKVTSSGTPVWAQQSGSTLAIITVNGMDVNRETSTAVVVGKHSSMQATFGTFVFTTPPVGSADGFIVATSTDSPTPVEEWSRATLPSQISLAQNYPNPFNPTTTIAYELASPAHVNLSIFNMLGQNVRTLVNANVGTGFYTIDWDGRDDLGNPLATGMYMYRLRAGQSIVTKTMLLLK